MSITFVVAEGAACCSTLGALCCRHRLLTIPNPNSTLGSDATSPLIIPNSILGSNATSHRLSAAAMLESVFRIAVVSFNSIPCSSFESLTTQKSIELFSTSSASSWALLSGPHQRNEPEKPSLLPVVLKIARWLTSPTIQSMQYERGGRSRDCALGPCAYPVNNKLVGIITCGGINTWPGGIELRHQLRWYRRNKWPFMLWSNKE
jgi:hypothetical protein